MKKNLLSTINIFLPIILFIILLFSNISEHMLYLITITLLVGWIIPYFVLLITGLSLLNMKNDKLTLVFNIVNILLTIMVIIFIIILYENKMLIVLIEYIIMLIISIINVIYLIKYLKRNPNIEDEEIKKAKKDNNGAIL